MIKAESKPFSTLQKFRVMYEFDKVYHLEVEKCIEATTEYTAHIIHYIDSDTGEKVEVLCKFTEYSDSEKAVFIAVEEAVEKYCKKHGIGEPQKPEER